MERNAVRRVRPAVDKKEEAHMLQKVASVALICATLVIAACNTVHGAAADVNSVANCTENTINGGKC